MSGQHQPFLGDVKVDGGAGLLAEEPHHMVLALCIGAAPRYLGKSET